MTRLTNTEYKNLFAEIESAETLDLAKLNTLSEERFVRALEANMGQRSAQSTLNRKFIDLIAVLEKKHNCTLVGRNRRGDNVVQYTRHEAGYNQFAWMNK